jgi:hypothetical protein
VSALHACKNSSLLKYFATLRPHLTLIRGTNQNSATGRKFIFDHFGAAPLSEYFLAAAAESYVPQRIQVEAQNLQRSRKIILQYRHNRRNRLIAPQ